MIQLKKISNRAFSSILLQYSFSPITKSPSYEGWHEQISKCKNSPGTHLIEYIFNGSTWLLFLIKVDLSTVYYMHAEPVPKEMIKNISKGAVLKLWLQLKNKYCLHASGILVDEQVILFIGPKGAGKSTTAAYFNSKGYPVWCDDYCILEQKDDQFYALPGETKLKIKNETIEGLSIAADRLKPLFLSVPEIEAKTSSVGTFKSYYHNPVNNKLSRKPFHKVKAIFILSERRKGAKVNIRPLNKVEGLKAIMDEIMLREIVSKQYMGFYFEETKNVLDKVNLFQVQAPNDLAQINILFEAILNQVSNEGN